MPTEGLVPGSSGDARLGPWGPPFVCGRSIALSHGRLGADAYYQLPRRTDLNSIYLNEELGEDSTLEEQPYKRLDVKDVEPSSVEIAAGDNEALDTLFRSYYPRLLHYGLLIRRDKEIVEDVIQELFIWMILHPSETSKVKDLRAYLFRAVKKNLHSRLSKMERSRLVFNRFLEAPHITTVDSWEYEIVRKETQDELQQDLHRELERLPPYLREVIYLKYFEGFDDQEIAQVLSVNHQVARNYASKAIKRLRVCLRRS